MSENKFELGVRVRDTISGFEGITTERLSYINGCIQYLVTSESLDNNGKIVDEYIFDDRLELVLATKATKGRVTKAVAKK